jgi:serine/threonine-protein kinase RsbW
MLSLNIVANFDSLDKISQYVLKVAEIAKLDKKTTYKLRLAVDEIATNIISYGYQAMAKEGNISLITEINQGSVTLCLEDTGIPYDPFSQEAPKDLSQFLEHRTIGGLGVYLAIQGVDKFIYERVGDRNRNILIINRT